MVYIFATGNDAVMTIFTGIGGLRVINRHCKRPPTRAGGVAKFTHICCHWMGCRLIGGISSGMAIITTIRGLVMIKRQ